MDPVEAGEWLSSRPQQLVFLTGIDPANRPVHNALLSAFSTRDANRPPLRFRVVSGDMDLPAKKAKKASKGILRRMWPNKYLEQVPALIAIFLDLEWDHPSWPEKVLEASSKVESLRASCRHGTKIAVVLLQERSLPGTNDDLASERAADFCTQCKISHKQLSVLPVSGELQGYVVRLEASFHEIAQGFYQSRIKAIRTRPIPNNSPDLLVRQLFKIGFLSELRQDTHTALRNYKLAYEHCKDNQSQWDAVDVFEWRSVVGLLNYKMCELNFLHDTARDAISHMTRHQALFFNSRPGTYPTPQLSAIEFALWKSKQCWQFAELFERAVVNGLNAVATINPGTFLDGAAMHFNDANKLIGDLKKSLHSAVPPYPTPDPLSAETDFYGQRPWKVNFGPLGQLDPSVEADAVNALQQRLRVNHEGVLSLLNGAIVQYKKFGCGRMQRKVMNEYSAVQAASGNAIEALRCWMLIMREGNMPPTLRLSILNKALWTAYSNALVKETVWACVQLLRSHETSDHSVCSSISHCMRCLVQGSIPSNPFPHQLNDQEMAAIMHKWETRLSTPEFFTVSCSRLQSFIEVSACFLHPEPCSSDAKVPVRVSLTLHSHQSITFSGIRVSCDVFGRRQTPDDMCPLNVYRSNISLQPFKKQHLYFVVDLSESTKPLLEDQLLIVQRVSLELGDRQSRMFGTLDWEGSALSKDAVALMSPGHKGQSSVRIVGLVGGVVNVGVSDVDCLLAEVTEVELILKNESNVDISQLRLELTRNSPDAPPSVLFVDDDNELRPDINVLVAEGLKSGEQVPLVVRLSSQLLEKVQLVLETSFTIPGEAKERRGKIPLSVTARDPFTVRSQVLSSNGFPYTNVLNKSTNLLKVDLLSHADLHITHIEWLLADVVSNAAEVSHPKAFEDPDVVLCDEVISYCVPIHVDSEVDSVEKPLGRLAVMWKRVSAPYPVRSVVPLCRTYIAPTPLSVDVKVSPTMCEMRRPIQLAYTLTNNTELPIDLTVQLDLTDTFMMAGEKVQWCKILPGSSHNVNLVVMALKAGKLPFPTIGIKSTDVAENTLLDALRNVPGTLFVLPLSKEPAEAS